MVPEDYLINRANFYLSLLDFAKRPAGPNYDEIKDVIVIFVCMFDPFDRDQKMYHFRMYDPKLKMELTPIDVWYFSIAWEPRARSMLRFRATSKR